VGIDADLLLKKVTNFTPRASINEGNLSLDLLLQKNIQDLLLKIRQDFGIDVIVVMQGLKPSCLFNETSSLVNSY
jgi:hypothetical protein